jgi:phosphohistidine phosphatase
MYVVLVHHGDAVPPDVDHMRPLSAAGRSQAENVANEARARGARPAIIWHSGKLRARQTAEICCRILNPVAELRAARGLQPDDDPGVVQQALEGENADVLAAGHMPHLARLLHLLRAGRPDGGLPEFPLHGAVALEKSGDGWEERWRIGPVISS